MKLKEMFNELIEELEKDNSNEGFDFQNNFMGMTSSDNGHHLVYGKRASQLFTDFSSIIYKNCDKKDKVESSVFRQIVINKIVNIITDKDFSNENPKVNIRLIKSEVEAHFNQLQNRIYHFPASTLDFNTKKPINLGDVKISSITDWLNTVDFSPEIKKMYSSSRNNENWKTDVVECLQKKLPENEIDGLAEAVYRTVKNSNSMISIEIIGYEERLSEKLAKQICKTALDMISLLLGGQRFFYNNVLQLERLPSLKYGDFTVTNGYLNLPSSGLSKVFLPPLDEVQYEDIDQKILRMQFPYSFVIRGLVDPAYVSCPNLVSRWCFALNWYAEGMRESNDAIAVAKLASCLDTLSSSGKSVGIKELLCNIYNCKDEYILFDKDGLEPVTVHSFVKRFYEEGRSRILHGTLKNMLESFEFGVDRNRLAEVARWVLLELVNRLCRYKGKDDDIAFRDMQYGDE
ncbi:hypothetical protein E0H77_00540 [Acinetobacter sp. ANC 4633]|uniref:HEPN domain-containing protein n=1 Tax=Acinetobacter sp. ANC 4633 TaxID=2529845 RepID=UPI00103FEDA1|nr:HEPN domain-containing protein [Acinetobacter sp. ANC 4633]TCB28666.1 hypothetical protein E0H77_00540 [Acinetobacter sp. ANC 4633]